MRGEGSHVDVDVTHALAHVVAFHASNIETARMFVCARPRAESH